VICPQCQSEVPVTEAQYLSMYTCPKCTAVYFVDISGQPEFSDMTESEKYAEQALQGLTQPNTPETEQVSADQQIFNSPEPLAEQDQFDQVLNQTIENSLTPQGDFDSTDHQNEFSPEMTQDQDIPASHNTTNMDLSLDQNIFQNSNIVEESSPFSTVASEISSFGNRNVEVRQVSYNLKVTGLDSKELLTLFKEALEDMKLGWLPQDIAGFIKNGECILKDLSAVQAYIIAKRIQFLDIEMEWTQNAN
jgi:Zn-finger nucleic acid-binding protein